MACSYELTHETFGHFKAQIEAITNVNSLQRNPEKTFNAVTKKFPGIETQKYALFVRSLPIHHISSMSSTLLSSNGADSFLCGSIHAWVLDDLEYCH